MRRRDLILGAGATLAWSFSARAQQKAMPVIGFMSARSPDDSAYLVAAFRKSLAEAGFVEGQTVAIEYRWARGDYGLLPAFADDLAKRRVAVLVAAGGDASALAAKAVAATTPVIFGMGTDPVAAGMVGSLNRPGGNITGVNILTVEIEAKRLGILNELAPGNAPIGALINPKYPPVALQESAIREAAKTVGRSLVVARASSDDEIDGAFAGLADRHVGALLVGVDPFFDTRRDRIIALSARHRLPTIYQFREYAVAGGLLSYGVDLADVYRHFGTYAAKILNGAKPADLPVLQSVSFEFVVNLKTAEALGLTVPQSILAGATEVIE